MNQQTMDLAATACGGGNPALRKIGLFVASETGGDDLVYCVRADRAPDGHWAWRCNCPDYAQRVQRNAGHICKHMREAIAGALSAGVALAAAAAQATAAVADIAETCDAYRTSLAGGAPEPPTDYTPPAPAAPAPPRPRGPQAPNRPRQSVRAEERHAPAR